ncbi:MAG: glycosyltransferase [Candidatus Aminicenantales bacterium]|jgi:glycosyltransferase involved in cell wall biosynthesis
MKRLKVLVSAYACNPLGSPDLHPGEDLTGWRLVRQIARFHDVWVLTHSYNKAGIDPAGPRAPDPSVRFHFIHLGRPLGGLYKVEFGQRIYYYLWQVKAWRTARRLHRDVGFDIAHHVTFGNDWIASYIGAFLPVPFILGPVGGGQRTPRGLLGEYTAGGRLSEKGRNAAQWIGRHDPVRGLCLRNARAVLVCNRETKDRVPLAYQGKTLYFPVNGISPEDLNSGEPRAGSPRPFRVFMAGRFHRLKGFALAVRGFRLFSKKFPDSEFVIVGNGPEEENLRRLISGLGLDSKVRLAGWLTREELLREMRSSDVFLFPSFRDGGGAVVVEAMASSKPVIGLDSGGPGLHIQPDWGFKIDPRDPSYVAGEIAAALETLRTDPALGAAMGEAARRRAEDYYLWDRHGDRLRGIYGRALGEPEASS